MKRAKGIRLSGTALASPYAHPKNQQSGANSQRVEWTQFAASRCKSPPARLDLKRIRNDVATRNDSTRRKTGWDAARRGCNACDDPTQRRGRWRGGFGARDSTQRRSTAPAWLVTLDSSDTRCGADGVCVGGNGDSDAREANWSGGSGSRRSVWVEDVVGLSERDQAEPGIRHAGGILSCAGLVGGICVLTARKQALCKGGK
ncbi:hypothetical protein C8R43DRAFT_946176 [Mycena crocata]|nr:hypothetical protein C8R43DRAFT_946176 [Mycena crocata]